VKSLEQRLGSVRQGQHLMTQYLYGFLNEDMHNNSNKRTRAQAVV
jgi:hypothetical protein